MHIICYATGVILEYFTNALGPALTAEAAVGWTKFLDLMIEVVTDTAKGDILHGMMCRCVYKYTYILDDETYKKTVLTDKKYGLWMGEKVNLTIERCTQLVVLF